MQAVMNKEKTPRVYDVWTLPDYKQYLERNNCINKGVGRYAKGKWSQLQITFEAVGKYFS
jgi:hypothetical protein